MNGGTHGFVATLKVVGGQTIQTQNRRKAKCYKEGVVAYRAGVIACPYNGNEFFGNSFSYAWNLGWKYAEEQANKRQRR